MSFTRPEVSAIGETQRLSHHQKYILPLSFIRTFSYLHVLSLDKSRHSNISASLRVWWLVCRGAITATRVLFPGVSTFSYKDINTTPVRKVC